MRSFIFTPTKEVSVGTLEAPSTWAKVRIEPVDAYVDATIEHLHGSQTWTATVQEVPMSTRLPCREHRAVLCLSRGELGKSIGTIQLGAI